MPDRLYQQLVVERQQHQLCLNVQCVGTAQVLGCGKDCGSSGTEGWANGYFLHERQHALQYSKDWLPVE